MKTKEQIFETKTLDAATNLILTKMEELLGDKAENIEMKRRRWIWELIQNANDCSKNREIDIFVNTNKGEVTFSHTGDCFTYENLVDLITQISTKVKDEEKIGKFGTGFIATHLLSSKVRIQGYYHETEESRKYKNLDMVLDRSGGNATEISEAIKCAFSVLDSLENEPDVYFQEGTISTKFIYNVNNNAEEIRSAIEKGFFDWEQTIPLVLAFTENIRSVQFRDISVTKKIDTSNDARIRNIRVEFKKNNVTYKHKIVSMCENQSESVACVLSCENGKWYFDDMELFPKLFCVFPLIGTERFPFPVVINSKKFHVSQERNSIHESVEENLRILNEALELYNYLLSYWVNYDVSGIYYMCQIYEDLGRSSYLVNYQKRVESIYKHACIVPMISLEGQRCRDSLYQGEKKKILIPFYERDKKGFWLLFQKFTRKNLPLLEEVVFWKHASSENCISVSEFIDAIERNERIEQDIRKLGEEVYFEIINSLNEMCFDEEKLEYLFKNKYLNQRLEFIEINKSMIDDGVDEELKDILEKLGINIRTKLIHPNIVVHNENNIERYSNEHIAMEICVQIRRKLASESGGEIRSEETQCIYNQLTDWFIKNNEIAKKIFMDIYEKQHLLTKPEETIRRLKLANEVEDMLKKNNINFSILNEIVDKSSQLLQIMQNAEKEIPLEIRDLLEHISIGTAMSAEYFKKIMERSISNVHAELVKNPLYVVEQELTSWCEGRLSQSVFVAQKKGKEIHIVIRPSDNQKIIFYEDAEYEALDECESELWTDDGEGRVLMITLGDLLKTTGITRIPLKKIIE